jgi:hypothetical protein
MKRLVIILAPIIVVIFVLAFAKPRGIGGPAWVRWFVASLCFLVPIVTALLMRDHSQHAPVQAPVFLSENMRKLLPKIRLLLYIYALIAGAIMVVMFRNVIPLRFSILAVIANVILISLICRNLLWNHSRSRGR